MKKFCTRCGKKFVATGREVICPACKQAAAEESKRAAVLRAKKASWTGEASAEAMAAAIEGQGFEVVK